jgi:AraC family L-rhamnose operon transcriptional activator RhaR
VHHVLRQAVFAGSGPPVVVEEFVGLTEVSTHGHAFLEFAVVLAGSATHVSSSGTRLLRQGSLVVMRPGEWHGYADVVELSVLNIYVGPELLAHELRWVVEDPRLGALFRPRPGNRLGAGLQGARLDAAALRRIEGWCTALGAARAGVSVRTSRVGYLLLVIGELAAAMGAGGGTEKLPAAAHPTVVRAAHLLDDHLREEWSVPRLAQTVNVAPAYLMRLFTRHLGLPPMAYLNRLRAERAAALLIETDLPVASIGALVGWVDPSYTSRRFRSCFDMSPARYRAAFRPTSASGPPPRTG